MTIAGRFATARITNRSVRLGITTFFILRIWFFLLGALGVLFTPIHTEMRQFENPVYEEELNSTWFQRFFLSPNYRYDTAHYLEIARNGYASDEHNSAFAPLFPALIWILNQIFPSTLGSAVFVASLAAGIAFILFHHLIIEHSDEQNAWNTLLWLCVFPSSFILFLPYTESLFLALMLGFFLAIDRGKYCFAALLAALATLTRFTGVFLSLVLVWDAFEDLKLHRYKISTGKWFLKVAAATIPVITFFIFTTLQNIFYKTALPWDALSQGWNLHFGMPWDGIIGNARELIYNPFEIRHISVFFDLLFALFVPVMLIKSTNLVPTKWLVFFWVLYLSAIMKISDDSILTSTFRYTLPILPIYMVLSRIVKSKKAIFIGISISFLLQALIYSMVFMWLWII